MTVFFYTLGCKVNAYETEAMKELFQRNGFFIEQNDPTSADIIVINSCTVTAESDKKTRQSVRKFKRNNPGAIVVLTGCMPQAYPEKAKELTEADIVTGNKDHSLVVSMVEEYIKNGDRIFNVPAHQKGDSFENMPIAGFEGRTRAVIKIQDGCDRYCTYCIIPTSKGHSRSRSLESLSSELDKIKLAGFREVVLVGINFCCYGLDIGKTFVDAIELACSKGFDRVRIGSLEFDNISDEAIDKLAALQNFCPQFHISLQSGCDSTLKRMNRHYTAADYEMLCRKLRAKFKDATVTTDLMIGFPGETDDNFNESISFAQRIQFEKIHVFPYSVRTGTKAAQMPQVDPAIKSARTEIALKVATDLRSEFFRNQIGKTLDVLVEKYNAKEGIFHGYTMNYTPVSFRISSFGSASIVSALSNKIIPVKITGYSTADDCCIGEAE